MATAESIRQRLDEAHPLQSPNGVGKFILRAVDANDLEAAASLLAQKERLDRTTVEAEILPEVFGEYAQAGEKNPLDQFTTEQMGLIYEIASRTAYGGLYRGRQEGANVVREWKIALSGESGGTV